MNFDSISRKNFLKLIGVGITGYSLQSATLIKKLVDFPNYERLGRVCILGKVEIKSRPSDDSQTVGVLYEDAVVPWIKDVVAKEPNYNLINQRWVETPDGYIYAANLQPVRNLPNIESNELISTTMGEGLWAEVTVPYVDVALVNNPSSNSWVRVRLDHGLPLRAYYGQVY